MSGDPYAHAIQVPSGASKPLILESGQVLMTVATEIPSIYNTYT